MYRVLAWLMYWVAGYLYNRIDIQNRHIHMLKAAQEVWLQHHLKYLIILCSLSLSLSLSFSFSLSSLQRGVPLVFLPCHKSHMDYILMTFILLNSGIHPPRIAAGDNLRLPFISYASYMYLHLLLLLIYISLYMK